MNSRTASSATRPAATSAADDLAEGFARHVVDWARQAGAPADSLAIVATAARNASLATQDGHVCTRFDDLAAAHADHSPGEVLRRLLASHMVAVASEPRALPLLIDDDGRIYLYRHFACELRLAANLRRRCAPLPAAPGEAARQQLDQLFAGNSQRDGARPDWQKLAVALAWRGRLTIISGGPGTGKTTTVVALLACLLTENPHLRIALAAPTGKAAARMLEALRRRAASLPAELRALLPNESHTLHRLLGVTPETGRFRHHAENPLPIDALIVDEASMLDLALACRLCEAVPPAARLILLGDKDQLAAVEAGAVFAEISADPTLSAACIDELAALTATPPEQIRSPQPIVATPLRDCVVWFSESHRFATTSGIGRLAAEINAGRGLEACAWLTSTDDPSVGWLEEGGSNLAAPLAAAIGEGYRTYFAALTARHADAATQRCAVFAAFDRFRVLCAMRETERGVHAINAMLTREMRRIGEDGRANPRSPWYPGRPVMILRNDYILKLFNGDIGICLPDESGELLVWFPQGQAGFRSVAPIRLPEHEDAFAITVHKSQGSEFASVLLLLPEQPNRVLTRELLYTGVTRASQKLLIVGSREVVIGACAKPTRRHSGLIARLRESGT
ncbi:MAG TPA: exodeoxyribonuclease V subunit alpha [Accumulibacter sp.]|nr:exodeoxyribonuclease V subunit alpha [Accumulibacter sp.]HND99426.1 exodeoxyribonuclease V subunit alpha [Plasticicumulans sp.]